MRLPDQPSRSALLAGGFVWFGAWAGRSLSSTAVLIGSVATVAAFATRRRSLALLLLVTTAGSMSGSLSIERDRAILEALVPEGSVEVWGTAVEDPRPGSAGYWFLIEPESVSTRHREMVWNGPRLLVSADRTSDVMAGDRILVSGRLSARPGTARGDAYAGRVAARSVERASVAEGLFRVANLLRSRVEDRLAASSKRPAAALVSGFLIGDIRELPASDADALRRAGLSHFVAVSGSNVALFLTLWWVIVAPLGFGPRRRAVLGLLGLVLFVLVTRWEPSVLRAAVMAGFVLLARVLGVSIGPWTALGGGVAGLLLVSGELVSDVGFQLSVAATAGVIAGAGYRPLHRVPIVGAALAATVSAQLAVAPLLLIHFGTLPLLSPVTNLLAGPLVAAATSFGGIGVLVGIDYCIDIATTLADFVLAIARSASPWPQIGWIGYCGVMAAVALGRVAGLRRVMGLTAAAWAFIVIGLNPVPVARPAVVFLDVGQGDSTLLLSEDGAVVLIDGGPNEGVLISRLRHYGIGHIDLVVASHQHHDHVTGLIAALDQFPVGLIWHSGHSDSGPEMRALLDLAASKNVPVEAVRPGWIAGVGSFSIEVRGPVRRYASPNDQSIVLVIEAGRHTILMPGDVETYAQKDLGPIQADVLKVPHQGAATSDLDWIRSTGATVAVIPVGPNDYGHPSPDVLEVLDEMGAEVWRTDRDGDVVISVGD